MAQLIHHDTVASASVHPMFVDSLTCGSDFGCPLEFAERDKGTLAPGMLADVAVLSQDIFKVPRQRYCYQAHMRARAASCAAWEEQLTLSPVSNHTARAYYYGSYRRFSWEPSACACLSVA